MLNLEQINRISKLSPTKARIESVLLCQDRTLLTFDHQLAPSVEEIECRDQRKIKQDWQDLANSEGILNFILSNHSRSPILFIAFTSWYPMYPVLQILNQVLEVSCKKKKKRSKFTGSDSRFWLSLFWIVTLVLGCKADEDDRTG